MSNSRFFAGSDWSQTQNTNSVSHYLLPVWAATLISCTVYFLHHITFNIFMHCRLICERLLNIQLSTWTALFKQHTKLHSSKKITHKSVYLNINHKINTIYKIHAILSHDNPRKKKWLPMQALPHTGHVTPVYCTLYTQRLEHTCQHRFSQTVFPTQNTTQFNTVQTPCLLSDSPLPTASCKPHTTVRAHYILRLGRTDRYGPHRTQSIVLHKQCS